MRCRGLYDRSLRQYQSTLGLAPLSEKHLSIRYFENDDVSKQLCEGTMNITRYNGETTSM